MRDDRPMCSLVTTGLRPTANGATELRDGIRVAMNVGFWPKAERRLWEAESVT